MKLIAILISHILVLAVGFTLGTYSLPIIVANSLSKHSSRVESFQATHTGNFSVDRLGSDFLHWGKGNVLMNETHFSLTGSIAPGPSYRLYFSPHFIENEEQFLKHRDQLKLAAYIHQFDNFTVNFFDTIDLENYSTVVIWCEAFNEFITSAEYKPTDPI